MASSQQQPSAHQQQQPSSSSSSRPYDFILRLDNGAVIGTAARLGVKGKGDPNRVLLLGVAEAAALGHVGPAEVARLEKLVGQARMIKRQLNAAGAGGGAAATGDGAATAPPKKRPKKEDQEPTITLPQEPSGQPPFYQKSLNILEEVSKELGKHVEIFNKPVDAKQVPDYYTIVKTPMDLGTIKEKLVKGAYQAPKEFADDMRLVWTNCFLYNKKGDFVEKLGQRASQKFENYWAMSGFADEPRSKRATAGLAAPKYDPGPITTKSEKPLERKNSTKPKEPVVADKPKPKPKPKPISHKKVVPPAPPVSTKAAPPPAPKVAASPPPPPPAKPEPDEQRPMTREQMHFLAEGLSSLDGKVLEEVIKIIKENSNFEYKEGEEIELDIGELNNKTLWKLEAFLKAHQAKAGSESPESGVIVNKDSSSDSDSSDSESDSESD